jgi:desulfoferrodoxin-like iron-binding protein
MKVTKVYQSYRCPICGNIVEVTKVGGGELVCCGKPMELITEKLTDVYLGKAFAGESQARNKYDYFASQAKKEGLEQIAGFFTDTALNEKEHAKREFKFLNGIKTTTENLQEAYDGENYEIVTMYPDFAAVAKEEGRNDVAAAFLMIAKAEEGHRERYKKLKERLDKGEVFKAGDMIMWRCRNCGYIHIGKTPPEKCPACEHPQAYFERMSENY